MAKKDKNNIPNPNVVPNRDIIHRLNFLYQASVYLHSVDEDDSCSTLSTSQPQPEPQVSASSSDAGVVAKTKTRGRGKKRKIWKVGMGDLAKAYIGTMKVVSTKTTVRMDPSIKRTLCRGCNTVLVVGSTASVRVKGSPCHGHSMRYTCLKCQHSRNIPAPPTNDESDRRDMDMDMTSESAPTSSTRSRRGKLQKSITPRGGPPLFARDVGHVVFVGEREVSVDKQVFGNGSFVT
ncbi:hypothetical protein E1B28_003835 [Marasmius oreades]|uniref:Rpr2-domain-containing protein n=1 Tax=Marasmius oreades TaxID=181124 RepID=A0A9P7UXC5_9AGAR|nr:uncharacterized protein E1B28_003835 [Marasmius oreades]KAG7096392.1 hypothetical protein E1B28_003835 [Marasmius oreades]